MRTQKTDSWANSIFGAHQKPHNLGRKVYFCTTSALNEKRFFSSVEKEILLTLLDSLIRGRVSLLSGAQNVKYCSSANSLKNETKNRINQTPPQSNKVCKFNSSIYANSNCRVHSCSSSPFKRWCPLVHFPVVG